MKRNSSHEKDAISSFAFVASVAQGRLGRSGENRITDAALRCAVFFSFVGGATATAGSARGSSTICALAAECPE